MMKDAGSRMSAKFDHLEIEQRHQQAWEQQGTFAFDRTQPRSAVFSIDTPPPTVSGSLHVGHVFSYTHTDVIARYQRMRGKHVFYPMGWDDNGLPTERRVQNYFGVRCDPVLPYEGDDYTPPEPDKRQTPVSRKTFIRLCEQLTAEDEKVFESLWRRVGLSVDWNLTYTTIDAGSRQTAQRAFLRNLARGEAYQADAPGLWDVTFQTAVAQAEVEGRDYPGYFHAIRFGNDDGGDGIVIETTRPELIPAVVALIAHPDDERYAKLFGTETYSPLFGVAVPVLAHPSADPEKGSGIAMCCTFGDLTDVVWWRELSLPTRSVLARDGRMTRETPVWIKTPDGTRAYEELAGKAIASARTRIVELLRESGDLVGEPRPVNRVANFYEKGDRPLEIIASRQWYLTNGGRNEELRAELLDAGRQLTWVPEYMEARYRGWVEGLNGDWLISRQRFFGVPLPVWYPIDSSGKVDTANPIAPEEDTLPVDPAVECPPGYDESQRNKPGGFQADPDVMDTWATSSLTPQIVCGWERDPELFARTFPMDMRPQAHDIIRTWLFSTVTRSVLQHNTLPWHTVTISGFVVDPDRKKMSKSKGNVVVPTEILDKFGADAVRWRAATTRPGTDTPFDEVQMKVGRRLVMKVFNASKFVLGFDVESSSPSDIQEPVDVSMLDDLSRVVADATTELERFDYSRALETIENFFWVFCDYYIELVKDRAYAGEGRSGASAKAALALALSIQLRLFAPFLPFVTEEVWSWWQEGSVHRASWPSPDEIAVAATDGNDAFGQAREMLEAIRQVRGNHKLGPKPVIPEMTVRANAAKIAQLEEVVSDVRLAGKVSRIVFIEADEPASYEVTSVPVE
jgi:valyl-tRNA synthetase